MGTDCGNGTEGGAIWFGKSERYLQFLKHQVQNPFEKCKKKKRKSNE